MVILRREILLRKSYSEPGSALRAKLLLLFLISLATSALALNVNQAAATVSSDTVYGLTADPNPPKLFRVDPGENRAVQVQGFRPLVPSGWTMVGRGIVFDGIDLWYSIVNVSLGPNNEELIRGHFRGDGYIHKMSRQGSIPGLIPDGFGMLSHGIGAMDFYRGNIWFVTYLPYCNDLSSRVSLECLPFASDSKYIVIETSPQGNILGGCYLPYKGVLSSPESLSDPEWRWNPRMGGPDSFAIVNGKILTTGADNGRILYEYNLDCTPTGTTYTLPFFIRGIDTDRNGNLITVGCDGGCTDLSKTRIHNMGRPPYSSPISSTDSISNLEDITTSYIEPIPVSSIQTFIKDPATGEDLTDKIVRFDRQVQDTTVITGSLGNPTGKVTYHLYNNRNCSIDPDNPSRNIIRVDPPVDIDPRTGAIPPSSIFTLNSPGSVGYKVYYSGDSTYRPAWSICEPLTFAKLRTLIVDDVTQNKGENVRMPFGRVVHDTAVVDTGGPRQPLGLTEPTGMIWFLRYNSSDCTGDAIVDGSNGISVNGTLIPGLSSRSISLNYSPDVSYKAVYSGDAKYEKLESTCEHITVSPPSSITTTIRDQNNTTINISSSVLKGTTIEDSTEILFDTRGGSPADTIARGHIIYQQFLHDENTDSHLFCDGPHTDFRVEIDPNTGVVPNSQPVTLDSIGIVSFKAVYEEFVGKWRESASSGCEWIRVIPSE
jgi:hypothetical protein